MRIDYFWPASYIDPGSKVHGEPKGKPSSENRAQGTSICGAGQMHSFKLLVAERQPMICGGSWIVVAVYKHCYYVRKSWIPPTYCRSCGRTGRVSWLNQTFICYECDGSGSPGASTCTTLSYAARPTTQENGGVSNGFWDATQWWGCLLDSSIHFFLKN